MLKTIAMLTLAASAALALPAHAAGRVNVNFVEPDRYADIGQMAFDSERMLAELRSIFQGLGRRLPDGSVLQIDVLDVDLAGSIEPRARGDLRVLRGGADWPRMHLRYALRAGETPLKSGEARISDMNYFFGIGANLTRDGMLPYEKRMVERWFDNTFVGH